MPRDHPPIYEYNQHAHNSSRLAPGPLGLPGNDAQWKHNMVQSGNFETSRPSVSEPKPDHARNFATAFDMTSAPDARLPELSWTWPSRDVEDNRTDSDHVDQSPTLVAHPNTDGQGASRYLKKRAPRATVACRACRATKSKCDEKPRCEYCTNKNIECKRDIPPPRNKPENSQLDIINRLDQIMESHEVLKNALVRTFPAFERNMLLEISLSIESGEEQHERSLPASLAGDSRKVLTPSSSQYVIPSDHTTAAAKVLQWPAVANIVRELFMEEEVSFDPLRQELEQKPIMEEVQEKSFDLQSVGKRVDFGLGRLNSSSIISPSDSNTSVGPPATKGQQNSIPEEGREVKLDEITLSRLGDVYLTTIGAMHPIIEPRRLKLLMGEFLYLVPAVQKFVFDESNESPREILESMNDRKRKRLKSSPSHWQPQESINVATVLLVLALGRVCESRGYVCPIPSMKTSTTYREQPILNNGQYSQIGSPELQSQTPLFESDTSNRYVNIFSEKEDELHSRVSGLDDHTPGLAFFAAAMKIFEGSQTGGNTLQHVQANLLAGLYCGQLARVLESHAHYSNASRILYMLLSPRRPHLEALVAGGERLSADDNQLVITFWTCLQLESDILAELDVPQSPILAWESTMPWPDFEMTTNSGLELEVVECYIALLWLRKRLNQIHNDLYGPHVQEEYSISSMNHLRKLPVIESLRDSLEGSSVIAPSWTWNPEDPPSTNILAARLRAKYYGGRVIVHRPFLRMVLNNGLPGAADNIEVAQISPLIMNHAATCIQALIKSSQAFQNVESGRFILTNPWGTAYAQWANILILLAVYQHPTLRQYVTFELLQDLSRRTLRFVETLVRSSPTLGTMHTFLSFAVSKVLGEKACC